jgi:hypothetical protein
MTPMAFAASVTTTLTEHPEYMLFGGAALVSLIAYIGLILVPAVGSYGRAWEKIAASFLSVFVLLALVLIGVAIGVAIVYYYNDLSGLV